MLGSSSERKFLQLLTDLHYLLRLSWWSFVCFFVFTYLLSV